MVTVSIVTYHTDCDELRRCLASLASPVVRRVTIVDNGAEDRLRQFLADTCPSACYIASANRGYGAGHNVALRAALDDPSARYHLVLNSDVRFDPDVLTRLVAYMDANPDVALVHPQLTHADGTPQWTARALPRPFDLIVRRFLPAGLFARSRRRYLLMDVDRSVPFDVGYVQGSFMLMRLDALRQAGLFDERFFMYPEDIDLTRRLAAVGRVVCNPAVSVVHDHRAASYHSNRMLRIHIVNIIRYFNKWGWLYDPERRRTNRRLH